MSAFIYFVRVSYIFLKKKKKIIVPEDRKNNPINGWYTIFILIYIIQIIIRY